MKLFHRLSAILAAGIFFGWPTVSVAQEAQEAYEAGLALQAKGEAEGAAVQFKKACMAAEGSVPGCLTWAGIAEALENEKDMKRGLSSAVMLDPSNVEARYLLGMMLLKKKDYVWAIEHFQGALPHAVSPANLALLHYYLGYAFFKSKEYAEANTYFALAKPGLSPALRQRCAYYLGVIGDRNQDTATWGASMLQVADGPDRAWSDAALNRLERSSAFPRRNGFSGQVTGSLGINTHPASAFLDDVDSESLPVLQSVFRADGIATFGGYTDGFVASLTAYREQNWTELGEAVPVEDSTVEPSPFEPHDFNVTLFLPQVAYLRRAWLGGLENEFTLGLDGETQFLDNVPKKTASGRYVGDGFGMNAFAVAGKFWWAIAANDTTAYEARLRVEVRPNYIDADRSTTRYRLRLLGTKHLLQRKLRLKALVGTRYDRTYHNPAVLKYDRIVPELDLTARWRTPLPRFTVQIGGKLNYAWYVNARGDETNSFRPAFVEVDGVSAEENAAYKQEYYDVTRQDFDWELDGELQLALWKKALLALTYRHHQRLTNLDDAPVPLVQTNYIPGVGFEWERAERVTYGYRQDVIMLELRQGF